MPTNHVCVTPCFTFLSSRCRAGAFLLASGQKGKRYSLPNSRIMIHQPLGGAQGQAADIEIQASPISNPTFPLPAAFSPLPSSLPEARPFSVLAEAQYGLETLPCSPFRFPPELSALPHAAPTQPLAAARSPIPLLPASASASACLFGAVF